MLGILSENLATAVKGECKSGVAELADYNFHSTACEQEFVRSDSQTYVRIASTNYPFHPQPILSDLLSRAGRLRDKFLWY